MTRCVVVLMCGLFLAVAACSREAPSAPAGPAEAPVVVPAPVPLTQPASSALPCTGADLKLTVEGGDAGMGNRVATLALQNLGARSCSLTGYPTVTLADASGRVLITVKALQEPGNYFAQGSAPVPVPLKPQAKAFFDLAWNVVPHEAEGENTCPEARALRLTTPGDTALVTLPLALTPCGRQVRVSPFRPVVDASAGATPAP